MEELLKQLQDKHGLSADQSSGILSTITSFLKEKFPMLEGAISNFFPEHGSSGTQQSTGAASGSLLDKISDFIPGDTGEKIEEFAKDKLGGILGK